MPPTQNRKPARKIKRRPSSRGDVKSDTDLGRAKAYEKTPAFRKAVREAYTAQPVAQRKQIAAKSIGRPGAAAETVAKANRDRTARNRVLRRDAARKDTKSAADLKRGQGIAVTRGGLKVNLAEYRKHYGLEPPKMRHVGGSVADTLVTTPGKALKFLSSKTGGPLSRSLQTAADLPANTVTTTYKLGKDVVTGHPDRAVKDIYEAGKETLKHPLHDPLMTVLVVRGVKGAAGHTAGKVMRSGATGTTAKRLASTSRSPIEIPGMHRQVNRQYSRDPSSKAVQVATEKVRRKVHKRGGLMGVGKRNPDRATAKDVKRAINEDVQAAKVIQGQDVAETITRAQQALNVPTTVRGKVKARAKRQAKPTAATNLAAQGITTASRTDLAKYLQEIKAAAKTGSLTPDELARNKQTQGLIEKALKNHDPAAVRKAAAAYSQLSQQLEQQVIAHRFVDPHVAETTRLAGVKTRRVKRKGPTLAAKEQAGRAVKDARREAGHADAAYTKALTDARETARTNRGRVPPKEHDALLKAIAQRDKAHTALEQAQDASKAAKTAHTRAFMPKDTPEPAYVSHQDLAPRSPALPSGRPKIRISAKRTGEAIEKGILDVSPAKLVEQAAGTQRLISAAKARNQFIDNYGFRESTGAPNGFASTKAAERYARDQDLKGKTGQEWTPIRREDGQVALVPKVARDQLLEFEKSVDAQHPVARGIGTQWRRNVLAFSPRWLTGNTLEAGLRSLVAGAGPMSQVTARRTLKRMDPEARKELLARTASSGQYSTTLRLVEDRQVGTGKDLGRFAESVAKLRKAPVAKQLADVYNAYTNLVFRTLNGNIETAFRVGMLGRALRNHPLMDESVLKVSHRAVQNAADALSKGGKPDINLMAELGRKVDDMYGRYDKYSPELQATVANYTPFIAWTLNATNFLFHVLPRDHPVLVGVMASANEATKKWRKQHGLYLDFLGTTAGQVPPWLMGSIPGEGGSHLRLSRYTPFGLLAQEGETPIAGLEGLLLPQLSEITANLAGKDWQDKPLSENPSGARDVLAAVASFLEGQVPLAAQVAHVTGARLPNVRDTAKISPKLSTRAREQFDPFRYTPGRKSSGGGGGRKLKAPGFDFGGGGGDFDFSGGQDAGFNFGG